MRIRSFIAFALLSGTSPVVAGEAVSPYAGQEARGIKSLSTEEIRAYLAGEGMGFARAAELNHYPGPKHVLELADKLELTEDQRRDTQAIFDTMRAEALRLGKRLVELEAQLDSLFAAGMLAPAELEKRVQELASVRGRIRIAHLKAHLAQRKTLTTDQIRTYDTLRGYRSSGEHDLHHHGH